MNTSDFDYYLPTELIAQTAVEPRDASRLLVVQRDSGLLEQRRFADIVEYLRPGDLLVANDSRVIPARLHGHKASGGRVELLLLRRVADPGEAGDLSDGELWECLVGGKGLRPGVQVVIDPQRARSAPPECCAKTGPSVEWMKTR